MSARNPGAAPIDEFDVQLGYRSDQVEAWSSDSERPEMAGLMISHAGAKGELGPAELISGDQSGEVLADVHRVRRDEGRVKVVGQAEALTREHQGGRRLGADHRVTVADGVSQDAEVGHDE